MGDQGKTKFKGIQTHLRLNLGIRSRSDQKNTKRLNIRVLMQKRRRRISEHFKKLVFRWR